MWWKNIIVLAPNTRSHNAMCINGNEASFSYTLLSSIIYHLSLVTISGYSVNKLDIFQEQSSKVPGGSVWLGKRIPLCTNKAWSPMIKLLTLCPRVTALKNTRGFTAPCVSFWVENYAICSGGYLSIWRPIFGQLVQKYLYFLVFTTIFENMGYIY